MIRKEIKQIFDLFLNHPERWMIRKDSLILLGDHALAHNPIEMYGGTIVLRKGTGTHYIQIPMTFQECWYFIWRIKPVWKKIMRAKQKQLKKEAALRRLEHVKELGEVASKY